MKLALKLASQALGRTNPNPVVGAVIVKNGEIVGQGYHRKAGTPHAEVHALNNAGSQASGAAIYVTLEPCSHYGKTPPCANALVKAGIKRAVIATLDPNPKVAGQGLEILNQAGIETKVGVLEAEALRLNEVFFKYIRTRRPFVALKYAMTLDGKISTYTKDSRWVTGESAREYVHKLRNVYDGIMVGIGTVLADDPLLNTRLSAEDIRDPIRVIIDGKLDLPLDSKVVKTAEKQKTIVFTSRYCEKSRVKEISNKGIEVIPVEGTPLNLDLGNVLQVLGEREICSLMVEGGAELNASFLEQKLVDKIYCFMAPKIIGGQGFSPVAGKGKAMMNQAWEFKIEDVKKFGSDILVTAYTGG